MVGAEREALALLLAVPIHNNNKGCVLLVRFLYGRVPFFEVFHKWPKSSSSETVRKVS